MQRGVNNSRGAQAKEEQGSTSEKNFVKVSTLPTAHLRQGNAGIMQAGTVAILQTWVAESAVWPQGLLMLHKLSAGVWGGAHNGKVRNVDPFQHPHTGPRNHIAKWQFKSQAVADCGSGSDRWWGSAESETSSRSGRLPRLWASQCA